MSSAASAPSANSTRTSLKRNSSDIGWEHGTLVNPNDLNVVKCNYCNKVVKAGIYRLKCHIAGEKGVTTCVKATPEAVLQCKNAINESKRSKVARLQSEQEMRDDVIIDVRDDGDLTNGNAEGLDNVGESAPQKMGPMDKFTMPMDPSSMGKTKVVRQQKISEAIWKERMHMLKRYIAKWVYVHGIPFHAINNVEFDQMLEAAGRFGPGAKKPNQHELREKLLYEEVEDTKKLLKVQEVDWASNGCSIMTDAWTDQKRRSIMNLCLHCSIGTSFLESKEASDESHTGQVIFDYVNSCIERVGANNVVQVVTDNASNNMAAKDLMYVERPNIFWSSCATHTINLMLEGIGKMKRFKNTIEQAKAITIFIYSHHKTLALMRRFTKKRDIVRPGVTRFASSFLTLQSLYEKKGQLRAMSQCEEWDKFCRLNHIKKNKKAVQATGTMVKPAFWSGVALCLRVFEPLIKVLRMVDGDIKPSMAFLYGEIQKAKKEIMVGIGNADKTGHLYNNVIEIIDAKMKDRLDSPLHLAAYFLNPYYGYNDPSIFTDEHVMDGFISAVETFYHGNYDKQSQVLNEELYKYKDKLGHFAKPVAKLGCNDFDFSPAKWWGTYGTQVPTLQMMATRMLSLTSSSSGCERNWSCFEGIHTKKRNKLTCERLNQLVFVQYNNKMHSKKEKAKKNKNMDPLLQTEASKAQGWLIEGGDEEDIEPVTGLTWKLIEEACGADEVTKLRRSARLSQERDIDEEVFESDAVEEPINEEEIEFESDQEEVVPIMEYEGEGENDN
ncbi:uncharacterized protein LOC133921624 isoform X1 [Phragmites australis]|uniref:uncharacterized protein LOC133921624 isoform X1 n=1 Tax=Phragmites australis TaxID=29695 RepID=UPI002D7740A4|nr:uncharacterized protein LOC133921624 isoform X1 [Phragmites australis]